MEAISITGISKLWSETYGDPTIRIAVLDGITDLTHACFKGANIKFHPHHQPEKNITATPMVKHGTHVSSVIFGQHHSKIKGIAPNCNGLLIPVFSDTKRQLSQLDLARAIELAVESGALIINISGGQFSESGEGESWLKSAVEYCYKNNVLVIAAAGNNGCDCLHVPARLPGVLAVGAMDETEQPVGFSNWGEAYSKQGILAPGKDISGALPGGGITQQSGTSLAAPIVTGVAALLLSMQLKQGENPDPNAVRQILLNSSTSCKVEKTNDCRLFLAGKLNIKLAINNIKENKMSKEIDSTIKPLACECEDKTNNADASNSEIKELKEKLNKLQALYPETSQEVTPSSVDPEIQLSNVFAFGTIGYDFASEARRDAFKQLMSPYQHEQTIVPPNPYDARQMVKHLEGNLSETKSLIWTLNMELTPLYAIEADGPFARDVYETILKLLKGQIKSEADNDYIERISIPGVLTGKTVTLFSGQEVPVIKLTNSRGVYGWKINTLIDSVIDSMCKSDNDTKKDIQANETILRTKLKSFLERVYYSLRNLGTTSQDRALNYAATNAFMTAMAFSESLAKGMELDEISTEKSPFGRMDSDCWDILLKFFDPENNKRAKRIYRYTIDVSETMPVSIGIVHSWSVSQ